MFSIIMQINTNSVIWIHLLNAGPRSHGSNIFIFHLEHSIFRGTWFWNDVQSWKFRFAFTSICEDDPTWLMELLIFSGRIWVFPCLSDMVLLKQIYLIYLRIWGQAALIMAGKGGMVPLIIHQQSSLWYDCQYVWWHFKNLLRPQRKCSFWITATVKELMELSRKVKK